MKKYLTTIEFAKAIKVTKGRVCQLIWEKEIQAEKFGRDWMIPASELKRYQRSKEGKHRFHPAY